MLELNLPKPLGGNDSQMFLHTLIQPKRPQEIRFKETTKNKRRGIPGEEEHQNEIKTKLTQILKTRGQKEVRASIPMNLRVLQDLVTQTAMLVHVWTFTAG